MVPELAEGMRSGRAFASAPSSTSVILCDVSTFPAAIGAGATAFTTVRSGAMIRSGRTRPDVKGTSSSNKHRKTYPTAALTIAKLAFTGPARCGELPVKSTMASELAIVTETWISTGLRSEAVVVEHIRERVRPVGNAFDRRPHHQLGITNEARHIPADGRRSVTFDQSEEPCFAAAD